jgi:hypothetical protein
MTKQLTAIPATSQNMETFRQLLISLGVHPMHAYPSIQSGSAVFGCDSTGLFSLSIYTDGETSLYWLNHRPANDWRYTNVFKSHESMFEVAQFVEKEAKRHQV